MLKKLHTVWVYTGLGVPILIGAYLALMQCLSALEDALLYDRFPLHVFVLLIPYIISLWSWRNLVMEGSSADTYDDVNVASAAAASQMRECRQCERAVASDDEHCEQCGFCVAERSHHCWFASVCVSRRTRRFYTLWLLWSLVSVIGVLLRNDPCKSPQQDIFRFRDVACRRLRDASTWLLLIIAPYVLAHFWSIRQRYGSWSPRTLLNVDATVPMTWKVFFPVKL